MDGPPRCQDLSHRPQHGPKSRAEWRRHKLARATHSRPSSPSYLVSPCLGSAPASARRADPTRHVVRVRTKQHGSQMSLAHDGQARCCHNTLPRARVSQRCPPCKGVVASFKIKRHGVRVRNAFCFDTNLNPPHPTQTKTLTTRTHKSFQT